MDQNPFYLSRKNLQLVLLLIGGLLAIVIGIYVLQRASYGEYKIYKTPYQSVNFSQVKGEDIYSYNGAGFYKQNIASGSVSILQKSPRLAAVKSMYWADDKGVILKFKDSQIEGSILKTALAERNMEFNSTTENYLWYFDFKTSQLTLVTSSSVLSEVLYYFNDSFYYISYDESLSETDSPMKRSLMSFSVTTKKESMIFSDTEAAVVSYISTCGSKKAICYIENKRGKIIVSSIESGKKTILSNGKYNSLIPTANPEVFIGTINNKADGEDGEVLKADVYYVNLATKTEDKTGAKVAATESLLANTSDRNSFYLLEPNIGNSDTTGQFINGGKTLFGSYKARKDRFENVNPDEPLVKTVLPPLSRSENGIAMFGDTNDQVYLVAPAKTQYKLNPSNPGKTKKSLENCIKTYTKKVDYSEELKQFKVGVVYDMNYSATIKNFSECVNNLDPALLITFEFIFIGLSPSDGRFVTN